MSTGQSNRVAEQIGQLLAVGTTAALSDGQLLERFATADGDRAERAFAALVERHGPMVLRVCRSVLADAHAAEDAFQATFLVLARRGRSLWVEESVGPWLHQVALRTARCARRDGAIRRRHERAAMASRGTVAGPREDDRELERLLHEELQRLPDRYRVPLIVCDLEGLTQEHAARHLGWPVGTVKSRLSRARQRLRERLLRRGFAPGVVAASHRPAATEPLVTTHLVRSTSAAAIRFAARRALRDGPAAILAHGVLGAMSMTRWWKLASLLLVSAATVSGAGLIGGPRTRAVEPGRQESGAAPQQDAAEIPIAPATGGRIERLVTERGQLDTVQRADIVCRVEGRTTIISLLPEGTRVKKGDVVGELDSASLRDALTNQRITTQGAEASYQNAKLTREAAEIALKEYEEGVYLAEHAAIQGQRKLAESDMLKADARVQRTRQARKKLSDLLARKGDGVTPGDVVADLDLDNQIDDAERALMLGRFALEQAQGKQQLLENYTKPRTIRERRAGLEKASLDEAARKDRLALERSRITHLEEQILNCKLFAPGDGVILYARDPGRPTTPPAVEEGATVRERQILVRILDIGGPMQVHVKVPEARIKELKNGQKARVAIDAFPGESFTGRVTLVSPLPEPSLQRLEARAFTTHVQLDQKSPQLRPGMTATADIIVEERDDVLLIPTAAVIQRHGARRPQVAVKKPDGGFELRDVVLGAEQRANIEVKQGLKAGEQVATDVPALFRRGLRTEPAPPHAR